MPRVAIISTSYPAFEGDPSGHFVQTEARHLARDAEVVVITARVGAADATSDGARTPAVDAAGVAVWRLDGGDAFGWPGVATRVRARPWLLGSVVGWGLRARALLRSLPRFDGVVAHWAVPSAFPVARARGRGVPLEVVSHGADVRALRSLPSPARNAIVRLLLADVSTWRFVSASLHDELATVLGPADAARLARVARITPASIEVLDVRARSSALRAGQGAGPLFVCAGRLVPGKRFDRALEHAAREAGASGGLRVVVVGDGPERGRLEAKARALRVDARFVGRTSREDALAWIGAADALLHASHTEGLSTVVREAEALGVRVMVVP